MKTTIVLFFCSVVLFMSSCVQDETLSNDTYLMGSVKLFDDGTNPVSAWGVTVTVEGLSPEISAVTDNDGNFILKNVPVGKFNLIYSKEGYGTFILTDVENKGKDTVSITPSLGQVSSAEIQVLLYEISEDTLFFSVLLKNDADKYHPKFVRYFFYKDTTNFKNFSYLSYSKYSPLITIDQRYVEYKLLKYDLWNMGFASGETVYLIAYGDSYYSNDYLDPITEKRVFPNLNFNAPEALPIVVP